MKIPFFFFAASLLSLSTFAQNELRANATPEQRAERQTRHLTKQLNLSPEQSQRLGTLNQAWARKLDSLRGEGTRPERGALRALQVQHETDLKALLTPEQWTTYERLRAERRETMRERRGNRAGGGR